MPLLRLRGDPAQAAPDPRFYQTLRGLMNVTAPMAAAAAGGGSSGGGGDTPPVGPPLFLSYPHFCGADPRLAAGVQGLACHPEVHSLFLDVGE